MCLARGRVGGVGGEYQSWRDMGKLGYVCVLVAVVLGGVGGRLGPGVVLSLFVVRLDSLC